MKHLFKIAATIELVVFDVDGVLTDGQLYFSENGQESKGFSTLDGQGIKMLQRSGIETAIITGRSSALVKRRADNLSIEHLYQGREDKIVALKELLAKTNIAPNAVCYVGDDLPDLAAIRYAGMGIAVANAHPFVLQHSTGQTERKGGHGAVRELCDFILQAQGKLDAIHAGYL
ncbi:MAG: phenylphosphate carboxylase subunit delta [Gammaproteobacteria bacterium]|nr:MAG: phenylphosphate carboxylase subunit delta [Gammaproteobacteria bacterium]